MEIDFPICYNKYNSKGNPKQGSEDFQSCRKWFCTALCGILKNIIFTIQIKVEIGGRLS